MLKCTLVTLSLICLCNAKSKQDEAALLYSKKTLSFVTSNSRVISQQLYRPLLQECVSIVAKIKEIRLVMKNLFDVSAGVLILFEELFSRYCNIFKGAYKTYKKLETLKMSWITRDGYF